MLLICANCKRRFNRKDNKLTASTNKNHYCSARCRLAGMKNRPQERTGIQLLAVMTLQEVADKLHLRKGTVYMTERRALRKLKKAFAKKGIKTYLQLMEQV
jgi:hypothetical protein